MRKCFAGIEEEVETAPAESRSVERGRTVSLDGQTGTVVAKVGWACRLGKGLGFESLEGVDTVEVGLRGRILWRVLGLAG